MWLVMRMEDGLDWQDAHMGSREIIVGGGWGRGLIADAGTVLSAWCAVQPLPLQLGLGFPSMLTQAQDQVTGIRWCQPHVCVHHVVFVRVFSFCVQAYLPHSQRNR